MNIYKKTREKIKRRKKGLTLLPIGIEVVIVGRDRYFFHVRTFQNKPYYIHKCNFNLNFRRVDRELSYQDMIKLNLLCA